jgi:hypothetical protein
MTSSAIHNDNWDDFNRRWRSSSLRCHSRLSKYCPGRRVQMWSLVGSMIEAPYRFAGDIEPYEPMESAGSPADAAE